MSKTQIYLGTDLLDFTGLINVKRQINDYTDPSIGASNKSYTLELPLTPSNQALLKFINDLRSREEVTDTARLVVDGVEIIRGKMRILSVVSLSAKVIIEADDWLDEISGTSIRNLSWDSGDEHSFTSANVSGSWTAASGALYRYPLINFAQLISEDYGGSGSKLYPWDFYPIWSCKEIIEKMFLDAGYTVSSSTTFMSASAALAYISSAPVINEEDFITGKALNVYVDDDSDNYDSASVIASGTDGPAVDQVLDIDSETTDEGSDFNVGTNRYTCPATGTYRFKATVDIYSTQHRTSLWTVVASSITLSIRKNGTTTIESITDGTTSCFDSGNNVYTIDTGYVHLESGDYIEVLVDMYSTATNDDSSTRTAELFVEAGATTSYFENIWSEHNLWPGLGLTIGPDNYLPDIDSVTFLKGLKEALDLVFFMDRLNKTIYIEYASDFFGDTVIDWTDKLDYSEPITFDVIASNYTKNQVLKFKPDTGDKAYTNEVAANGVPDQYEFTIDSEYAKPGKTVRENPLFATTVLGDMPQIGHWGSQLVPRIFGSQEFVGSGYPYPEFRAKSWDPRLFDWNGMTSLGSGTWDYHDDIEDTTGTTYTTFPQVQIISMQSSFIYSSREFYRRVEKNKLATCVLKLTPAEILKFTTVVGTAADEGFRATYKLNIEGIDMHFYVNKIITDGDRVKAELVQKM